MEEEKITTSQAAVLSPKTYQPVACILCGSTATRPVAHKGMFGWDTHVSICPNDGLVFLNPRWTKNDYDLFYATEYDLFYRFDESQAAEKEQRKAAVVWERLKTHSGVGSWPAVQTTASVQNTATVQTTAALETTAAANKTALDIGCGLGWNLHNLRQNIPGLEIYAIEPSDVCADHFTSKIGGVLIARDVDSDWEQANLDRFNIIVFRHVLEHLMNPLETLKKVRQALAEDGYLYIAVPDMLHPDGSLEDFWYRCVHTYYYSRVTLERIAALAGLQAVTIQEQNAELWAIFRKAGGAAITQTEEPWPNIYQEQLSVIHSYQRQRKLRSILLRLSPRTISSRMPKSLKGLIPERWKARFRQLVYRH